MKKCYYAVIFVEKGKGGGRRREGGEGRVGGGGEVLRMQILTAVQETGLRL